MDKGLTISQISIGQTYEKSVVVTDEMVRNFAKATGDFNPVHLDDEAAKKSVFGRRVAHGMLTAGLISSVFGTEFPGMGTIYMSQEMKFLRPVFIDDKVTVQLSVTEVVVEKNRIVVDTVCFNQKGKKILDGQAMVMPPA